eukprot:CAMPEP_0117420520 /NCGR_PEP_ID=MMETSP0758-20121206/1836_1 /TAXON_ID=63605 /ORGANISM="Percolomonas cosmopolitus, Strain AE-1 (ATCC 50343)" /LENGTH=497 /DNA_ID=CAMNT_0005202175 /DNA_START=842 /DNA_END=2331 /DNA_ORIENTATION=+
MANEEALKHKEEGNKHYKKQEYEEAIKCYTKAIELEPENPVYLSNRAAVYLNQLKFKEAIRDSEAATRLDANFTKGYYRAGQGYIARGMLKEARKAFEKAKTLDANDKNLIAAMEKLSNIERSVNLGEKAMEKKEFKEAKTYFNRALEVVPHSFGLKLKTADAALYEGDLTRAEKLASEVIEKDSSHSEAYFIKAKATYYKGQSTTATRLARQAIQYDMDYKDAKKFLKFVKEVEATKQEGNTAFKGGNLEEAKEKYNKAIQLDPLNRHLNAVLHANLASVAIKEKKYAEAIRECNKSIKFDEKYVKAYIKRAQCHIETKDYEKATHDLNSAQRIEPNNQNIAKQLRQTQNLLKKAERKDYYKILDIKKDASAREIKKAYRKMAAKYHPDRHMDDEEGRAEAEKKLIDVNEAYDILSDEQKKYKYDNNIDGNMMGGFPGGMSGGFPGGFSSGGMSGGGMEDILRMMMGGGGGPQMGGGNTFFQMGGFPQGGRRGGRR